MQPVNGISFRWGCPGHGSADEPNEQGDCIVTAEEWESFNYHEISSGLSDEMRSKYATEGDITIPVIITGTSQAGATEMWFLL